MWIQFLGKQEAKVQMSNNYNEQGRQDYKFPLRF